MKSRITQLFTSMLIAVFVISIHFTAYAQPISANVVLKEGDPLVGSTVTGIRSNPYNNGDGEVGFIGNLANGDQFVWIEDGVVFLESDALPDVLGSFEGTMGIGNNDAFIISASFNGDDAVLTQNGLLAVEEVQAPGFPAGTISTFHSRPSMLPDGTTYWVSGFNESGGTSSEGRMLYKASPAGVISIVYRADDVIDGQVIDRFDGVQFSYNASDDDNHLISEVNFTGSTTSDGALIVDGSIIARENSPIGTGDDWDNFDQMDINNNGDFVFSGDTDGSTASDEFIAVNGSIVIREGDVIDGVTLNSSAFVRALALNNNGDVLHTWGISGGVEVLFYGNISDLAGTSVEILRTDDMIDTDGDNIGDFTITDFNASSFPSDLPDNNFLFVEVDIEDLSGNEVEAIIQIELEEPECGETLSINCPENQTINLEGDDCFAQVELPSPEVGGGCGELEVSLEDFEDIPSTFPVGENLITYTVTDEEDNTQSCTFSIFVLEGEDPIITFCPPSMTLDCAFEVPEPDPSAVTGTDNCGILNPPTLLNSESNNGQGCPNNELSIVYTYELTDVSGNATTCQQVITVVNNDVPTIDVVPNITVDCFESINPNPNQATISITCGIVSLEASAPLYQGFGLPSNCPGEQFLVTYTLVDNCGRVATANQIYTIENGGPVIECPDNCEVLGCFDGEAEAVIEAWINTVTATSSCSDDLTVFNTYSSINGTCVFNGFTPVTFSATDNCGRTSSCESGIYIVDSDPPVIAGDPSDLLVPCTANTEDIFAEWLTTQGGVEATDECSAVTWSTIPANPLAMLDCSNGPQAIVVEFVATDQCGNAASTTGVFNTKLLPTAVNVSGMIHTEMAQPVADVQVGAMSSSMSVPSIEITGSNGDFGFPEIEYEEDLTIEPEKNNDWLNGVTTYDLILLQQHILGGNTLDSPYKRIAADANRSGTISTLDLVLLRRLILHIDEDIADNTSWRFVDASFVFPNPEDPFEFEFPESFSLSGAEEDWADFVAVKIGDLNLDAELSNLGSNGIDRNEGNLNTLNALDQELETGEVYSLELRTADWNEIKGFQFTIDFDPELISFKALNTDNLPDWSVSNYSLSQAEEGIIPVSWNTVSSTNLSSQDVALRIEITAKSDILLSEALNINSSLVKAESYTVAGLSGLQLNYKVQDLALDANGFDVFQNQPNPFDGETLIRFNMPSAGQILLDVMDITGRVIYQAEQSATAGYNEILIKQNDLGENGIYYYRISFGDESSTRKMVLMK